MAGGWQLGVGCPRAILKLTFTLFVKLSDHWASVLRVDSRDKSKEDAALRQEEGFGADIAPDQTRFFREESLI